MEKLILLLTIAFLMQSCGNGSEKESTKLHISADSLNSEHISQFRPNEKIKLGKVYTDTVEFIAYNDDGDYQWLYVKKSKDTLILVNENNYDRSLLRGDEIEVQWKMDSIWIAGEGERLDFAEWLTSIKKLNPLKLVDKKVKFLWRETHYVEEYKTDINYIILNEEYIRTISEPEKAALAYVATFIGNECEWDGKPDNRSNLKCKILWALDLGYQCSQTHLGFLRSWFKNNDGIMKELENCPTTPDGATVQDTFDEIQIEVKGNKITVFFNANGFNSREGKSWNWTETHFFEFNENELILINKVVSPMEKSTVEIRGN